MAQDNMIIGGYTGTVLVELHIPAGSPGLLPPGELNRTFNENMSGMIEKLIKDEFGDAADVTVAKQESWVVDPRENAEGGGAADGVHKTGQ